MTSLMTLPQEYDTAAVEEELRRLQNQIDTSGLTYQPASNPANFGAAGDGITDDTAAVKAALASLTSGGSLRLSGVYYMTDLLEVTVNEVAIIGEGSGTGFIFTYDATTMHRIKVTSNNVTLSNFDITEVNVTARTGIYGSASGEEADDLRIENLTINDSSATGIHLIDCQRAIIKHNTIRGTWADGIHVQRGSQDFVIEGNICDDNGDDCIGINSHGFDIKGFVGRGTVTGNTLGNTTTGKPGSGIALNGAIGVTVTGNNIENTGLSGIKVAEFFDVSEGDAVSGNHIIANNVIRGGGTGSYTSGGAVKHGISVFNSRNVKVDGNIVINSDDSGIVIGECGINIEVTNNIINEAGARGIWCPVSNQTGSYLELWDAAEFDDGESQAYVRQHYIKIQNNTIKEPQTDGIYLDGGSGVGAFDCLIKGNSLHGVNAVASGSGKYGIRDMYCTNPVVVDNVIHSAYGTLTAYYEGLSPTNRIYSQNYPIHNTQSTYIGGGRHFRAGAAPSTGTGVLGDVAWNWNPGAGGTLCWVCTTAGSPGTWTVVTLS